MTKIIIPLIIICAVILSLANIIPSYESTTGKMVICLNDPTACPNTNVTVAVPIIPSGVVATLHIGDCADAQILVYQLSNSTWICGNNGGVDTDNFLTSINSDTTSSQVFSGTSRNVTITDTGAGTLSWNLGDLVVTTNGVAQNFTSGKKVQFTQSLTTSGINIGSAASDISSARRGDIRIAGASLKYNDNTNTTQIITPSSYLTTAVTSATGTANNVTVSASTGAVTWNLGSNVVTTGGSTQVVTKGFTINSLTLGGDENANSHKITSLTTPTLVGDAQNAGHLGLLGTLTSGAACANAQVIIYQSSNSTWICGANGGTDTDNFLTSINSDTTAGQTLQGTSRNVTVTNSGAIHTWNLGDLVVTTNGVAQNFTSGKKVQFTQSLTTSGINIGSATSDITSPRRGDMRIVGTTLKYNDNTNTTQSVTLNGLIAAVTSINSDTTAAQTLQGTSRNVTVTNSGATHTWNLGDFVVTTNGVNQTMTKSLNFTSGQKLQLSSNGKWSPLNIGTLSSNPTRLRQGDVWIAGTTLKYNDNTNTTQSVTLNGLIAAVTSINSDSTAAQVFSGTANNVTITDTGAGTLQWNLGSNVVTTNGVNQTMTKSLNFTSGQKVQTLSNGKWASLNIGTTAANPTRLRQGDLFISGNGLFYNDNINSTRTVVITGLAQTIGGAKTFTAANLVTTGSIDFSNTADTLKLMSSALYQRNPAGTFGYTLAGGAITKNITTTLPVPTDNVMFAMQPRYNFTSPANQSSTASATWVMYGGFATLTPRYSTNATITVSGFWNNNLNTDGCWAIIKTSTSNMGVKGTAASGTSLGSSFYMTSSPALGNQTFSQTVVYTGDVAGTKQFFDIAYARTVGGNCHIYNTNWFVREQ